MALEFYTILVDYISKTYNQVMYQVNFSLMVKIQSHNFKLIGSNLIRGSLRVKFPLPSSIRIKDSDLQT